jgi:hypothetical protein
MHVPFFGHHHQRAWIPSEDIWDITVNISWLIWLKKRPVMSNPHQNPNVILHRNRKSILKSKWKHKSP